MTPNGRIEWKWILSWWRWFFSFSPSTSATAGNGWKGHQRNRCFHNFTCFMISSPAPSLLAVVRCAQLLSFLSAFIDKHEALEGKKIRGSRSEREKQEKIVSPAKTATSCKKRFFCTVKSFEYDVKLVVSLIKIILQIPWS